MLSSYLEVAFTSTLICLAMAFYVIRTRGSHLLCCLLTVLIQTGIALQVLLGNGGWHVNLILLVSTVCGVLVMAFCHWFEGCYEHFLEHPKPHKLFPEKPLRAISLWLLVCGGCAVYLVLLLFGTNYNGTRAWLYLGQLQFQLTELSKPIFLAFLAILFTYPGMSNPVKYLLSLSFLGANLLGLVLIGENGTALILIFIYLSFCLMCLRPLYTILNLAGISAAVFTLWYTLREALEKYLTLTELGQTASLLTRKLAYVGAKIKLRFDMTYRLHTLDPNNEGYQAVKAREALAKAGWFGNDAPIWVPVEESDYAYVACVQRFGWVMGIFLVVCLVALFFVGRRIWRQSKGLQRPTCMGCVLAIISEAFLMILGTCGLIPVTGVPLPFLSSGGSYNVILYAMVGFILFASRSFTAGSTDRRVFHELPETISEPSAVSAENPSVTAAVSTEAPPVSPQGD